MTATKGGTTAKTVATDVAAPAGIAPATTFEQSGAPVQPVPDIDPDHPAVDNDPRKRTSVEQNRIDFNDPTKSGADTVTENLAGQAD